MPIKPKKRIGKHSGTGGPRYCQPPGKSGCSTSAQTARVVFADATCRDGAAGTGGAAERRAPCAAVTCGGAFFGATIAGVSAGGIFVTPTSTGGALAGAAADGGIVAVTRGGGAAAGGGIAAVTRGDGAVAAGGAADATDSTTAGGCAREISLAGGDA